MNFLNRLKFYLIGFGLGVFFIYFLFNDREWDWLPENKVKKCSSKDAKTDNKSEVKSCCSAKKSSCSKDKVKESTSKKCSK